MESRVTDLGYGGYGRCHSSNSYKRLSAVSGNCKVLMSRKRKTPDTIMPWMGADNCSEAIMVSEKSKLTSVMANAPKDNTSWMSKGQDEKDQKMDIRTVRQCAIILKKLMSHQVGWVFNQPVDPVKLNIPDYFSIISKPMDLGTIKRKLEGKLYSSTHQFAADVRLTFSNAMQYNPPGNEVHIMAKELNNIFNLRWKLLEDKWIKETVTVLHKPVTKDGQNQEFKTKQAVRITSALSATAMRKCAKVSVVDTRKVMDDETLKTASAGINDTCVSMEFSSRCQYDVSQASVIDVDSDRSLADESHGHDCILSDLDFKNSLAEAAVIEDNAQTMWHLASSPVAARKDAEDSLPLEQLSPTKALRAAMLKSRFADTIIKAQQKTLLNHGNKVDRVKMQREKEKLEKQQQEEKARIEAHVKAAEASARKKAEYELKMQREKEREAARLALRKMEKTVDINDNFQTFKDLESLAYSLSGHQLDEMDRIRNPLEKLGLFIKREELDEPDDHVGVAADNSHNNGDVEEGEIGCL
ncbi:transcription factor GTE9-like isoform X1 [Dioscorea cayenensis subsp. rotundata]|uniref:Transcription factor GTE9-like isoform X1 n=1 Tax=Dioscorea cayennensis subsp. rotundata TaxID=55577 RepID=A0AB40BVI5_DIOCR|nr:transcription factor GTE9-like isoform X1 [Dioscorea cayenensis subsp. rotundata]